MESMAWFWEDCFQKDNKATLYIGMVFEKEGRDKLGPFQLYSITARSRTYDER
jgi:hypothetical protein